MTIRSPGQPVTVSVVILNWNRADLTLDCYNSLLSQSQKPPEIIILDNASTDDSFRILTARCTQARVILNAENAGTGGGFAAGAKYASGDLILFLCNDTILDKDTIEKMAAVFEQHPDCAVCGAKHLYYDKPGIVESVGYKVDRFGMPHAFDVDKTDERDDRIVEAWVSGTALMIRRDVYMEIGGYDPKHFTLYDETDLCWRARIRGYRLFVRSGARVVHHHFATLRHASKVRTRYWAERHMLRTLLKNYSTGSLVWIIPQYLSIWMGEVLFLLVSGAPELAYSDIRALWWNLLNLPDTWRHHKTIQASRAISDRELKKEFWPGCGKWQLACAVIRTKGFFFFRTALKGRSAA